MRLRRRREFCLCLVSVACAWLVTTTGVVSASTYVVYIPLDSPIYNELDTLDGLGMLDSYISEIKPISRIEAARLTFEAQQNLVDHFDPLAARLVRALRAELSEELGWLERDEENGQPTMIHPLQRAELEYIYSRGAGRFWNTGGSGGLQASEVTPLLPNNDGIPTGAGSNEVARWSGWAGAGGFFTVYGEGAVTGPLARALPETSRVRPLDAEAVLSTGNLAISFGQQEMWWGAGRSAALSQSDNAEPFPALRAQNIHPLVLPGAFRYLGQFRYQIFFGQLDGERFFARPWIAGQIFSFKPLPDFEFGLTHAITFGGRFNDFYSPLGFLGRATGFSTGDPAQGNTNSRGGVYLKVRLPSFRNLQIYQEILGEDNLTREVQPVGRFLPLLAVSYQGGAHLPRLTEDGRTDLGVEYALLEPNYSIHGSPLYWTYSGSLMGDALGPNATEVDLRLGRWLRDADKLSLDIFYTERAPTFGTNRPYPAIFYGSPRGKEHSGGVAIEMFSLPQAAGGLTGGLTDMRARAAVDYVRSLNYQPHQQTVRVLLSLSGSFKLGFWSWQWR
jgi:capsule assembly protein Wzi